MEVWAAMVVGMHALQGHPVTLVGEGSLRHSFVSNRDVAAFAVVAVGNPAARNRHLAIGGPEALSWRYVVATYERVLGRSIPVEYVAMGDPMPGLPEPMPEMLAGMETYDSVVGMGEISRTFDVPLTTLERLAQERVAS
jgi:nucleoside-diphosphate-sugar epimerase